MSKLEDEARKIAQGQGRYPTPEETHQHKRAEFEREMQVRELAEQQERNRVDQLVSKIESGKQSLLDLLLRTGLRDKLITAGKAYTSAPEKSISTKFYYTVVQIKAGEKYPRIGEHFPVETSDRIRNNIVDLRTDFIYVQLVLDSVTTPSRWEGGQTSGYPVGGGTYYLGPNFLMDENGDFWNTLNEYDKAHKFLSFPKPRPKISHKDWARSPIIFDKPILGQLSKLSRK